MCRYMGANTSTPNETSRHTKYSTWNKKYTERHQQWLNTVKPIRGLEEQPDEPKQSTKRKTKTVRKKKIRKK